MMSMTAARAMTAPMLITPMLMMVSWEIQVVAGFFHPRGRRARVARIVRFDRDPPALSALAHG
eukprot:5771498-Pyramimonas_sp.AAC.1